MYFDCQTYNKLFTKTLKEYSAIFNLKSQGKSAVYFGWRHLLCAHLLGRFLRFD